MIIPSITRINHLPASPLREAFAGQGEKRAELQNGSLGAFFGLMDSEGHVAGSLQGRNFAATPLLPSCVAAAVTCYCIPLWIATERIP